jgi:hypothetical protein
VWAKLPSASKQIYPVIGIHCDKYGQCHPGEKRISELAGVDPKTVREGIRGLLDCMPSRFSISKFFNPNANRFQNRYNVKVPPVKQRNTFFICRKWIDGGHYKKLRPTAKALWLTMASFSYYSYDEDESEHYIERVFENCEAPAEILCRHAGISYNSFRPAIASLEQNGFVEHLYYMSFEDDPSGGGVDVYGVSRLPPPRKQFRTFLKNSLLSRNEVG